MEVVTWILNTSLGNNSCDFHLHDLDETRILPYALRRDGPGTSKHQVSLALNI